MATYTWQAPSGGAFDTAADWDSNVVPGASDTALFNSNAAGPDPRGVDISGAGSADTIAFAAASWTIVADLTATTTTINAGNVSIVGGTGKLVVNGALLVGQAAAAALIVGNGGRLVVTSNAASGPASSFGSGNMTIASGGIASFGAGLNFGTGNGTNTAVVDAAVLAVGGVFQIGVAAGGGGGTVTVQGGANVALTGAANSAANSGYLQLGAASGTNGTAIVTGANSILLVASNGAAVGLAGTGTLLVNAGGTVRVSTANNPLSRALNVGLLAGSSGTVTVSGAGSSLVANGTVSVGVSGTGRLTVAAGARVTSATVASTEAALSVAASGGSGLLSIDGAGSQLVASGQAVVGGDDRAGGLVGGGTGSIAITNGGLLQTGSLTILGGSRVSIDGASTAVVVGNLNAGGVLASFGALTVTGAVVGGGLQVAAGTADVTLLSSGGISFAGASATLLLRGVVGANTIANLQFGDRLDFVGNPNVRLTGTLLTTAAGTVQLGAPPANTRYAVASDGAGGTLVGLSTVSIGVYRFFDNNYGTHFFSSSISEKDTIIGTRPDLVYEGVGLASIDPAGGDPNAAAVYRFFDSSYGTHFFTASADERDTVIKTRSDLLYEGTGFTEHVAKQPGDVPIYRFFDTKFGTHFYTADATERAAVIATRPDLADEGIGFYAPPQT